MPTTPINPAALEALIDGLRNGQHLDDTARALDVDLLDVWAAARTDTRLAIALAGRDPDGPAEAARVARADYLRLLALGIPPSRAELILDVGHPGSWRKEPLFAEACRAVVEASAPYGFSRLVRLTPDRVARFLEALRGGLSVRAAAGAVGVTPPAVYQRRKRDRGFAAAMDEARQAAREA